MEEAFVELSRHVTLRFDEEKQHVRQLQQTNEQTIERLRHVTNMAEQAVTSQKQVKFKIYSFDLKHKLCPSKLLQLMSPAACEA